MKKDFKIIGFDADDTLWVNEPYYRDTEDLFCELLSGFQSPEKTSKELFRLEIKNLKQYGYGAKGFMLSMIETALLICNNEIEPSIINKIIDLGKDLLNKPVVLLDGIQELLEKLNKKGYKIIVATKGDLLDQERKLQKSNLEKYFHHIEIMSDKKESNYLKLLSHLEVNPKDFLMIGNSLKSDIIPVIEIGGYGIHVPYHTTWSHENIERPETLNNFLAIDTISEISEILEL